MFFSKHGMSSCIAIVSAAVCISFSSFSHGDDASFLEILKAQSAQLESRNPGVSETPDIVFSEPSEQDRQEGQGLVDQGARTFEEMVRYAAESNALPSVKTELLPIGESPQGDKSAETASTFVFISLAMPESVLKSYFVQAAGDNSTVFVVRGWTPPDFAGLIRKINSLMPEGKEPANVIVDPELYRTYKVDRVPMFLSQDKKAKWRRVYGVISISGAKEQILLSKWSKTLGPTYDIKEPDIIDEIQRRAASYDWDAALAKAKDKVNSFRPGIEMPGNSREGVIYVDPTITINQDIYSPQDGSLIAPAGTQINPLSEVSLPGAYIVFDPDVKQQILIAKKWAKDFPGSTFIATKLPEWNDNSKPLNEELGGPVYALDKQIIERFKLEGTPTLIQQEGQFLKLTLSRVKI